MKNKPKSSEGKGIKVIKIKISNKWVDCLVIGDLKDMSNNFFAIKVIDVPKSAIKIFNTKYE